MPMTTLTKDQVRKLTPQQQEALGSVELQRIRARQHLLEQARRHRGMTLGAGLLMALACGLAIIGTATPRLLPFAVIVVAGSVAVLANGLNRRLDAMMELLDQDTKRATEGEQSNDDHAA